MLSKRCQSMPEKRQITSRCRSQCYPKDVNRCSKKRQITSRWFLHHSCAFLWIWSNINQQSICSPSCLPLCHRALSLAIDYAQFKKTTWSVRLRPSDDSSSPHGVKFSQSCEASRLKGLRSCFVGLRSGSIAVSQSLLLFRQVWPWQNDLRNSWWELKPDPSFKCFKTLEKSQSVQSNDCIS